MSIYIGMCAYVLMCAHILSSLLGNHSQLLLPRPPLPPIYIYINITYVGATYDKYIFIYIAIMFYIFINVYTYVCICTARDSGFTLRKASSASTRSFSARAHFSSSICRSCFRVQVLGVWSLGIRGLGCRD